MNNFLNVNTAGFIKQSSRCSHEMSRGNEYACAARHVAASHSTRCPAEDIVLGSLDETTAHKLAYYDFNLTHASTAGSTSITNSDMFGLFAEEQMVL